MKTAIIIAVLVCVAVAVFLYFRREPAVVRQTHLMFPDDENGDVLRRMQAHGDNLEAPRDINFAFAFRTQSEAERFATAVTAPDYRAEASEYPERKMWQAEVTHFMLPTHAAITELEARLSKVASEYGGEPDGWGSFQQP
jgi:hypothetical protein